MSTYSEAILAMESFFKNNYSGDEVIIWGADAPEKTDPYAGSDQQAWLRFTINHSDGRQNTLGSPGSNRFRHIGIITIQIFTPEGNYAIKNRELANTVLEIYQGAVDSGVYYENVTANELGNDGFGWYQTNVTAEFRYDNIT